MGLLQFIKEPTRITSTTSTLLDLFLCSHPHNVSTAATIPSPLSDHNVVILVRKINGLRQKPRLINCWNYTNYDATLFHDDLEVAPWDEVLALQDVNEAWLAWKNIFTNLCDKHAPSVTRKVRPNVPVDDK